MGLRRSKVGRCAVLVIGAAVAVSLTTLAAQQGPYRVGGNIPVPVKIKDVRPTYPDAALKAGIQGVVILEITVDTLGGVSHARVLRSIPMLDEPAVAAARQWLYQPTLLNGVAVPVILTATVAFIDPGPSPRGGPPVSGGVIAGVNVGAGGGVMVNRSTWRVPGPTAWDIYELTAEQARAVPAWNPATSYEPPLPAAKALSIAVERFRQERAGADAFELHHLQLLKMGEAWLYQVQVGSPSVSRDQPSPFLRVFILMDGSVLRPVRSEPLAVK